MQVIFMGTPEFSVAAFNSIMSSRHKIVACYTQPPRPASRGMQITKSPVHILAEQNNIPVFTPTNFKNENDVLEFKNIAADIAVVAAYGLLLPENILNGTRLGCINIHPSLLPRWRGAAPIHRPIISGDTETGCCIMQMDKGLDTGDVILEHKIPLPETANFLHMHNTLAKIGGEMVVEALDIIEAGIARPSKQSEQGITYAKKILKEEALINFQQPAQNILNLIRGLNPYPGAYTIHNNVRIKILDAEKLINKHTTKPGTVINHNFHIACNDGIIIPKFVQAEGKKKMPVEEFLKGFKL